MKKFLIVLILPALMFAACTSGPAAPGYVSKTPAYEVIDHKAAAVGGDIPDWVTIYISGGAPEVERLPQYEGKYVFVGEDSGVNLNALRQWSQGFTVNQELSRMVSTRVRAKFVGAAVGSPDAEYGRYFEDVVSAVSEASFSGARRDTDYWVLRRFFNADGKTVNREAYDYYVLFSIDRSALEQQINNVMNGVNDAQVVTQEQQTAVDRVREAFYEGF